MNDFEIGDIVKCVDNEGQMSRITIGNKYEVTGIEYGRTGDLMIAITDDNGDERTLYSYRFHLPVKKEPKASEFDVIAANTRKGKSVEFEEGDVVECVEPRNGITTGKTYKVLTTYTDAFDDQFVNVNRDDGIIECYYAYRFKPAGLPEPSPFDVVSRVRLSQNNKIKVGDKVKIKQEFWDDVIVEEDQPDIDTHVTKGKIYEVIDAGDGMCTIEEDDGEVNEYHQDYVEKIEDPKPSEFDVTFSVKLGSDDDLFESGTKFKVGDKVRSLDPYLVN